MVLLRRNPSARRPILATHAAILLVALLASSETAETITPAQLEDLKRLSKMSHAEQLAGLKQFVSGTTSAPSKETIADAVASITKRAGKPARFPTEAETIAASLRHCDIPDAGVACGPEPPWRPEFDGFSAESTGWAVVRPSPFAYLEDEPGWSSVIKPYDQFCRATPADLTKLIFGPDKTHNQRSTAVRIGPAEVVGAIVTVLMESEMTGVFFDAIWAGPAMLWGTVTETAPGKYKIVAKLTDPGAYTLRVTLMYEHSWYAYGPSKAKQAFYSNAGLKGKPAKLSWLQPLPLCRPLLVGGESAVSALHAIAEEEDVRLQSLKVLYDVPEPLMPKYEAANNAFRPTNYGTPRLLTKAGISHLREPANRVGVKKDYPRLQHFEQEVEGLVNVGGDTRIVRPEFKSAVHTLAAVASTGTTPGDASLPQQLKPCRGFGIDVPANERADYGRWVITPKGPVWRPLSCIAKVFQPDEIADCLARVPVVIVGDSHSRELNEELKQALVIAEIGRCSAERPVKLPLGVSYRISLLDYHTPTSADTVEQVLCKRKSQAITVKYKNHLGFVRLCHLGTNKGVADWGGMYNSSIAFDPTVFARQVNEVWNHAFHHKLKFVVISAGSWSSVGMDAEQIYDQWTIYIDSVLHRLWHGDARNTTIVWRSQAAYGHRRGPDGSQEHRTNIKIARLWARQKAYIEKLQARDKDLLRAAGLTRPRIVVHDDFNAMLPFFHNTADTTHYGRFGVDDLRHDWEWPVLNGQPGGACGGGVGENLECPFGNRGSNAIGLSTANNLLNSICAPDE